MHWDGKWLYDRDHPVERLRIAVNSTNIKQLITVPKLNCSTGKEQILPVSNSL